MIYLLLIFVVGIVLIFLYLHFRRKKYKEMRKKYKKIMEAIVDEKAFLDFFSDNL